jgi:hypothetical protein
MRRAHACLAAAFVAATALAGPARAEGTAADRDAARALSGRAYDALEGRHYHRAIALFQEAEARFHAPTHLLYIARAQVKAGLLLEAKATFAKVLAEKLPEGAPAPFREAQTSARAELAEVEALLPQISITLRDPPAGARVTLDGEPLASSDLGRALPRNPGAHAIVVEAPGRQRIERSVMLTPGGGDERVELTAPPVAPRRSLAPVVVAFSLGAAGLVAGTTAAVLLRHAPASQTTALRVTEVAGFTTAGVGAGVGVILLVLRSKAEPPQAASAAPRLAPQAASSPRPAPWRAEVSVGPGTLGLSGNF